MSCAELLEWEAVERMERASGRTVDVGTASIMALLANIHRDTKKKSEPFGVDDFLLQFDEAPVVEREQSEEEQIAIAKIFQKALEGK